MKWCIVILEKSTEIVRQHSTNSNIFVLYFIHIVTTEVSRKWPSPAKRRPTEPSTPVKFHYNLGIAHKVESLTCMYCTSISTKATNYKNKLITKVDTHRWVIDSAAGKSDGAGISCNSEHCTAHCVLVSWDWHRHLEGQGEHTLWDVAPTSVPEESWLYWAAAYWAVLSIVKHEHTNKNSSVKGNPTGLQSVRLCLYFQCMFLHIRLLEKCPLSVIHSGHASLLHIPLWLAIFIPSMYDDHVQIILQFAILLGKDYPL